METGARGATFSPMGEMGFEDDPVRVLVAGGGVAALETLIALRALAPSRVEVRLVSASNSFRYRPLEVGEPFGLGPVGLYDLAALSRGLNADFVHDLVLEVDAAASTVSTAASGRLGYDVLVLAVGGHPYPAFEHGVMFDRQVAPEDFDEVLSAEREGFAGNVAIVVPEGVTWTLPAYELALLTAARFPGGKVTLVTYEERPLQAFGSIASDAVTDVLDSAGVRVYVRATADVVTATALRIGWRWIEVDRIVALPMLRANPIGGVPVDEHGFVSVDEFGRVEGLTNVYAAGDGTTVPIKQGGLAAQQADALSAEIAHRLGARGDQLTPRLVLRGLLATPQGPRYLRAELDDPERTSAISEQPLWWPPSKIASRWLAPYLARVDEELAAGEVFSGPHEAPERQSRLIPGRSGSSPSAASRGPRAPAQRCRPQARPVP